MNAFSKPKLQSLNVMCKEDRQRFVFYKVSNLNVDYIDK